MTEITDLVLKEQTDLIHLQFDPTIICHRKYFSQLEPSHKNEEDPVEADVIHSLPLIFCPPTEDFDHENNIKLLPNITHRKLIPRIDYYSDDDADTNYLSTPPVSYLILGKPGIGQSEIAQLLSEEWKCVYINPDSVIKEELISGSRPGRCINYNLEAGRAVEPEVLLRLVEKRLKSETVAHRGAVISGFPLLQNKAYKQDPVSSESAVFNVADIFDELLVGDAFPDYPLRVTGVPASETSHAGDKTEPDIYSEEAEEEALEEQEETEGQSEKSIKKRKQKKFRSIKSVDLGPSDIEIVFKGDEYHDLADPKKQLKFLLNLLNHDYLVIIYLYSENIDVVSMRDKSRYDMMEQKEIFNGENLEEINAAYNISFQDLFLYDGNIMKRFVKLPHNFKDNVSSQLMEYRCCVLNAVNETVLNHNPEYVIKVDARLSIAKMFFNISSRLHMLSFQPVLIPEKLKRVEEYGEDFSPKSEAVEETLDANSFNQLRSMRIIGSMYKHQKSNWGYKGPVALKYKRLVEGKMELAVRFMNKIYLLSSDENLLKFCRNPRPFLLPTIPIPTGRVWIFGAHSSGKSTLAKCLSLLFKWPIFKSTSLERDYMERKKLDFIEKLRIASITEGLLQINKIRVQEREEAVEEWKREALALIKEIIQFQKQNISSIQVNAEDEEDKELSDEKADLKNKLSKLNLSFPLDSNIYYSINIHHDILMTYLPDELIRPIEPATVFDDYVTNYVEYVLQTTEVPDMSMTFEEKIDMFKTAVQNAENNVDAKGSRGGWIIDGMVTDLDIIKQLCPEYLADDIICIKDQDPEHIFMKNKYTSKNYNILHYNTLFKSIKKKSISNVTSQISIDSQAHLKIIKSILSDIQNQVTASSSVDLTEETEMKVKNYGDSITEFNTKWDEINEYLNSAHNMKVIHINPENKDMYELLREVFIQFESRYKKSAHVMTDNEREEEVADFTEVVDDEELGEGEVEPVVGHGNESFKENRRLGDTNIYCPVAFDRHFVLWKGKEELSVLFEHKVYMLSSASVMKEFVTNPTLFLSQKPIQRFPPMRICITGVLGSGKTTAAKNIALNYGIQYVNYDDLLLSMLNLPCSGNIDHVVNEDTSSTEDYIVYADSVEILKEYLNNNQTLANGLIKNVLYPLWFREPYLSSGFILDNFPRRSSDIEIMTQNYFIPDMVIEMFVTQEHVHSRLFTEMFVNALVEVDKLKRKMELHNKEIFNKWQEDRYNRLLELRREKRIMKYQNPPPSAKKLTTPVDSKLNLEDIEELEEPPYDEYYEYEEDYDELNDLEELNEILDQEMPPPVFDDKTPTEKEITQKIESQLETGFARDIDLFDSLRIMLEEANIDNIVEATSNKTLDVVLFELFMTVDKFKYRNQSLFERVYEIDLPTAESLLDSGYYFLSKFGRTCPVQVYDNVNPMHMFNPSKLNDKIYPLIHRRYIYFVFTEDCRDKFRNDPLKYTFFNHKTFPLIPPRIAIIGPPKSGKSTLAKRIKKEYNLNIITRGTAVRYIQNNLPNFQNAKHIAKVLGKGWALTYEMVAKAVEALTMDALSITQGYILDGFPNSEEEMKYFIELGIVPHVVLDLKVDLDDIKRYSPNYVAPNRLPTYSFEFIKSLYKSWNKDASLFRDWLHRTYQNVHSIENKHCEWLLWATAKEISSFHIKRIQNYLREKEYDQALNVASACVTLNEINTHQSIYKNYCPYCLVFDNILEQSILYPDRNSIVRYLEYYYYICPKHIKTVYEDPSILIPQRDSPTLPEDMPEITSDLEDVHDASQNGLCVVCFWDNQPKRVLRKGDLQYSIKYQMKLYAFCSQECQKKFMQQPKEYCNKVINFRESHPLQLVDFKKLPTLGYLEQFTQKIVTNAVVNTEILRPYHPCTTLAQSAALNMALFLKLNNPNTPKEYVPFHQESKAKFDSRRDKLKSLIDFFKSRLNPNVDISAYDNVERSRYHASRSSSSESGEDIKPESVPVSELDFTCLFDYFAEMYEYFGEDYYSA